MFFYHISVLKNFFSFQTLSCLVQIASVRRTLFSNEERAKFLSQLVNGVRNILQNPQVSPVRYILLWSIGKQHAVLSNSFVSVLFIFFFMSWSHIYILYDHPFLYSSWLQKDHVVIYFLNFVCYFPQMWHNKHVTSNIGAF